ncbi:MAG: MBL fold metallo-hydrolase [Planctomycetota bacterium]
MQTVASPKVPRRAFARLPLLLAGVLFAPALSAQQDFTLVQISVQPVAGAVHLLQGSGGNVGVSAGPDGVLIVDDQFEPLAEKIRAALDRLAPGGPRFILNTHWHSDHTGGNAHFGRTGTIVAHRAVRQRLAAPTEVLGRTPEPAPPQALPVVTFEDSLSLHWNGEEIRLQHLPNGHTDGDAYVHFLGSGVVHLGDLFFAGRFPFVDLGSGGDVIGLQRNIARLIETLPADVRIIPGHGPLSTLNDLRTYHRMLESSIAVVRQRRADGLSLADTVAAGLPEEWAGWGNAFISTERWLKTVYESLERSPQGPPAAAVAPAATGAAAGAGSGG